MNETFNERYSNDKANYQEDKKAQRIALCSTG